MASQTVPAAPKPPGYSAPATQSAPPRPPPTVIEDDARTVIVERQQPSQAAAGPSSGQVQPMEVDHQVNVFSRPADTVERISAAMKNMRARSPGPMAAFEMGNRGLNQKNTIPLSADPNSASGTDYNYHNILRSCVDVEGVLAQLPLTIRPHLEFFFRRLTVVVERKNAAARSLAKLLQHRASATWPPSLIGIKDPATGAQWGGLWQETAPAEIAEITSLWADFRVSALNKLILAKQAEVAFFTTQMSDEVWFPHLLTAFDEASGYTPGTSYEVRMPVFDDNGRGKHTGFKNYINAFPDDTALRREIFYFGVRVIEIRESTDRLMDLKIQRKGR